MKHLGLMTISPYYNRKAEISAFFELIKKHHPKFDSEELKRTTIYSKLFPGEEYEDQRMRDMTMTLMKLVEELLVKSTQTEVNESSIALVMAYIERGQFEIGLKTCERLIKSMDKVKERDSDHFYLKGSLINMRGMLRYKMNTGFAMKLASEKTNLEVSKLKSTAYVLDTQDAYQALKSGKSVFGVDFDEEQFEKLLRPFYDHIDDLPMEARLSLTLFTMNYREDATGFEAAKEMLVSQHEMLPDKVVDVLLINMQNFCKRRMDEGYDKFLHERFELFNWEIEKWPMADNVEKKMTTQHFMSAVATGLKVDKLDWVSDYIEVYSNRVAGNNVEDVVAFCTALKEFSYGNFAACKSILSTVEYGTYDQKLLMRLLELRLYFELKDFDLLESKIDSTRHFLLDTKFITAERVSLYLNFIRFLQQIMSKENPSNKANVHNLIADIKACERVEHKSWLLEKCHEI